MGDRFPRAIKRLGQNFLRDRRLADRIVEAVGPKPGDAVLEYGCGTGMLTRPLIASGARVLGTEVDKRLLALLRDDRELEGLELLQGGLEQWPPARVCEHTGCDRIKLIGNLPYQLTSVALFAAADGAAATACVVFMMQREVAERVQAKPGGKDFGILPALMQARFSIEKVLDAAPGAFFPRPKVHSRVLRFCPLDTFRVDELLWPRYKDVTSTLFGKRRKQIGALLRREWHLDDGGQEQVVQQTGLDLTRRPETLTVEELAALSRILPGKS